MALITSEREFAPAPSISAVEQENGTKPLVLLIDDSTYVRKLQHMLQESYDIVSLNDNGRALELLDRENPDIVIIGDSVDGIDTHKVVSRLREFTNIPVIVIGRNHSSSEKACRFLEKAEADDYLERGKLQTGELVARIKAILRRHELTQRQAKPEIVQNGELRIDTSQHLVTVGEQTIDLTPTEYKILLCFAQNKGRVLTRESILDEVFGSVEYSKNITSIFISHLRQKLGESSKNPNFIVTRFWIGYMMPNFDTFNFSSK